MIEYKENFKKENGREWQYQCEELEEEYIRYYKSNEQNDKLWMQCLLCQETDYQYANLPTRASELKAPLINKYK